MVISVPFLCMTHKVQGVLTTECSWKALQLPWPRYSTCGLREWNPQKPTKLDGTILLHHPFILQFCQLRIPQNSLTWTLAYSYPLNLHINKALSTVHSTAFCIQNDQYLPCSAATKVHNITDAPTCHADSVLLVYSTVQKWYTLISPTLNLPTLILPTKRVCVISPTHFCQMFYVGFECFESLEWVVLCQKPPSCGVDRYWRLVGFNYLKGND